MASRGKNWPIATVVTAKCSTLVAPANLLFWTQKPAFTFYTPLTLTWNLKQLPIQGYLSKTTFHLILGAGVEFPQYFLYQPVIIFYSSNRTQNKKNIKSRSPNLITSWQPRSVAFDGNYCTKNKHSISFHSLQATFIKSVWSLHNR